MCNQFFRKESTPFTTKIRFSMLFERIIGRNPSMEIPLLTNQDLTAMLIDTRNENIVE